MDGLPTLTWDHMTDRNVKRDMDGEAIFAEIEKAKKRGNNVLRLKFNAKFDLAKVNQATALF